MLTYHSSLDPYHCFFRVMFFLSKSKENRVYEIDKIRIIDFYLSSPAALKNFKFPSSSRAQKKLFAGKANEYNEIPNQRALFFEMQHIHKAIFDMMMSTGLIDGAQYKKGNIYLLRECVSGELNELLKCSVSIDQDAQNFAINNLAEIPLLGTNGLKDRSGLMDHK